MIARLRAENERTGVGSIQLLKGAGDSPPGLTPGVINNWLGGLNRTLDGEHYDYVLTRWAALPTIMRLSLTPEMIAKLQAEITRTGIGPSRLLRGAKDRPPGLSASKIIAWMKGGIQRVAQADFDYVLARLTALPADNRKLLTPDMRAALQAEIARTGMGYVKILSNAPDCPPGLTSSTINQWVSRGTGTVNGEHWDYVLARLRSFLDAPPPAPPKEKIKLRYVGKAPVCEADLAELRHHRERTGIGGAVLLRTARDKPEGVTPAMISGWLSGVIATARPEHVAYVLARYRAWP